VLRRHSTAEHQRFQFSYQFPRNRTLDSGFVGLMARRRGQPLMMTAAIGNSITTVARQAARC
jgi:hypothetical protein